MRVLSRSLLFPFVLVAVCAAAARAEFLVCKPPMSLNLFIGKALANADAEDVILVHPGTIDETVVIDYGTTKQSRLTIVRTDTRPTITGGVVINNVRDLVFEGFKVHSPLNDGIPALRVTDSAAVRLVDCHGQWLDDGGIDASGVFELTVDRCRFSGNGQWEPNDSGFGVRIVGRCGHLVRDTVVEGNTFRGIWIEASSSEVRDCQARSNGSGSASAGIYIAGMQNLVRDCEATDNAGFGIHASGGCAVRKNQVTGNDRNGIRYGDDQLGIFHGGEVEANEVHDNGAEGILVRSAQQGCLVRKNTVRGNGGAGIRVAGGDCLIADNTVEDTKGGSGVIVESAGNLIRANRFDGNGGAAVVLSGNDNYVFENEAKDQSGFVNAGGVDNAGRDNTTKGKNDFP